MANSDQDPDLHGSALVYLSGSGSAVKLEAGSGSGYLLDLTPILNCEKVLFCTISTQNNASTLWNISKQCRNFLRFYYKFKHCVILFLH
jgi:hypothetical protein